MTVQFSVEKTFMHNLTLLTTNNYFTIGSKTSNKKDIN